MNQKSEIVTTAITREDITQLDNIELLFFAYRDFVSDPDRILAEFGFGRAHHRVLYFVNRRPGLSVAELLDILKITKQSLARVLRQLIDSGHVIQAAGANDRRKRLLYPARKGRELVLALSAPQSRRIESAFQEIGRDAEAPVMQFMQAMIGTSKT